MKFTAPPPGRIRVEVDDNGHKYASVTGYAFPHMTGLDRVTAAFGLEFVRILISAANPGLSRQLGLAVIDGGGWSGPMPTATLDDSLGGAL